MIRSAFLLCSIWRMDGAMEGKCYVRRPLQLSKGVMIIIKLVVFRGGEYSVDAGGRVRLAWTEDCV